MCRDILESAGGLSIQPIRPATESDEQIEIAVRVDIGPRVGLSTRCAEQFRLHQLERRRGARLPACDSRQPSSSRAEPQRREECGPSRQRKRDQLGHRRRRGALHRQRDVLLAVDEIRRAGLEESRSISRARAVAHDVVAIARNPASHRVRSIPAPRMRAAWLAGISTWRGGRRESFTASSRRPV